MHHPNRRTATGIVVRFQVAQGVHIQPIGGTLLASACATRVPMPSSLAGAKGIFK